VAVLGERLAGAREVAAPLQAGVEHVQQRSAYLADLFRSQSRLNRTADVPEVRLARGQVPPGDRHVLVEQLGDGDIRVGLPPGAGELEQPAELDLRFDLGLAGLPEADLAPGQRVLPGVHLGAP